MVGSPEFSFSSMGISFCLRGEHRMGKKTGDIKGTTEQLNNNKAAKSQEEKKNKTGGIASCILHIDSLKNTASQF